MVVKIRVSYEPVLRKPGALQKMLALATGTLLMPASVMAYVLGLWRILADLRWAGQFAISSGAFSHWQVWIAVGILLHAGSIALLRYANAQAESQG